MCKTIDHGDREKDVSKIGMDSNSEERNFAEIGGRGLSGRDRKEKDRSLVMPRKRLYRSTTVGDNGKMSCLMEFNTGLTDAEAEKKKTLLQEAVEDDSH